MPVTTSSLNIFSMFMGDCLSFFIDDVSKFSELFVVIDWVLSIIQTDRFHV